MDDAALWSDPKRRSDFLFLGETNGYERSQLLSCSGAGVSRSSSIEIQRQIGNINSSDDRLVDAGSTTISTVGETLIS